jgi:hypothetical protein
MDEATAPVAAAARTVHCAEAVAWLRARGRIEGASVVTSLPDVSEVNRPLEEWREWFVATSHLVVETVADEAVAVFFQSDVKRDGTWVDKGALVIRGAEAAGARVLLHKIVCRRPPGMITGGRPGFTHLIAVSRALRCPDVLPIPDVIVDAGPQLWVRAMGVRAAAHAVRFARDQARATLIVDPFCGVGTVLAVANALGVAALGVEKSAKRAERARHTVVTAADVAA